MPVVDSTSCTVATIIIQQINNKSKKEEETQSKFVSDDKKFQPHA